jgi:hypothetical protein
VSTLDKAFEASRKELPALRGERGHCTAKWEESAMRAKHPSQAGGSPAAAPAALTAVKEDRLEVNHFFTT